MLALIAWVVVSSAGATSAPSAVDIDGIAVPSAQVQSLISTFLASKTDGKIAVTIEVKPDADMPGYDPHWHYAGSSTASTGEVESIVWMSHADAVAAKTDAGKHEGAVEIASGILLALMDSGVAGTYWKQFYDYEAARDKNDAPSSGNPNFHRESAAVQIASGMLP